MNDVANPLVSVVIPTYNHARYLGCALESVLDQTYTNWEAIVIDNHSTDNTDEVMASFTDPRITYLKIHNNGVIAASRNAGIRTAKGEWVAFLDSDDRWYPRKFEQCISHLENGADLVAHGLKVIGEGNGYIICGPKQRATFDALLNKGSCITPSATMIRKSILNKVQGFSESPRLNTAEDYHLWIKLANENISMEFLAEILGEYRVHADNQSGSAVRHMHSALEVIDDFLPVDAYATFSKKLRARRCKARPYYGAARQLYKNKNFSEAWPLFLCSVIFWPFQMRSYAGIGLNIFYLIVSRLKLISVNSLKDSAP
jgi:glycosyltransferase involved in cell wall biosynthesis